MDVIATKYNLINELYKDTLERISSNSKEWKDFLKTASMNYKYSFCEQVLIYAQKPEARACASIEIWNNTLKRWVNKGAKGIALLTEKNGYTGITYVFDVSDTNNRHGKNIELWKLDDKYQVEVIESLENKFGNLVSKEDIYSSVFSVTTNILEDTLEYYLELVLQNKQGSSLEKLEDNEIKVMMYEILFNSISYSVLNRCGINADYYITENAFENIKLFDNSKVLLSLGTITNELAKLEITEIYSTLKNIRLNEIHTFDTKDKKEYNIENERSDSYGRLQTSGGLSNTSIGNSKNRENTESNSREVFKNEANLSSKSQESGISRIPDGREIRETFESNTNRSNGQIRNNNEEISNRESNYRRNESERQHEVDSDDEQSQETSRRSDNSRIDNELNLFPSEEEQIEKVEVNNNTSTFSVSQEDIEKCLLSGSNIVEGKYRIYQNLTSNLSTKDNIEFMKQEYGIGGGTLNIDKNLSHQHDAKGITITKYGIDEFYFMNWTTVIKGIKEVINNDRWFNSKEKEEYQNWLMNKEILNIENQKIINEDKKYQYYLGATVYIGTEEYEILEFNDKFVNLYDPKYPLFNKEIGREEFDKKVKENPNNDNLIIKEETIEINKTTIEDTKNKEEYENIDLIGIEVKIDGRTFRVDAINNKEASLMDIDFYKKAGFPIFNNISKEELIENIKENQNNTNRIDENNNRNKVTNILPKVPISDRNNFKITDDKLGVATPKERFKNNIEAIKVLRNCENENRFAIEKEQEILSKYVGWGGLSEAFDNNNSSWANEYYVLKNLLTEEEYNSARESTLTAFYTPPIVIRAMYKAIENMGFKDGNILEPSCGTGNFIGMLPDNLQNSKMYGVELDSVSGRIARQLYQNSSITINGFEKTDLPNSFFDIAISNVPFGDIRLLDKKYDKHKFLIHDYFFAKTLDKVRPGGIIAFITSKGTMDKENPTFRKYISQRADLLGAIRLPDNVFKGNAGTEVTSDIIFLQKRDSIVEKEEDWVYLDTNDDGIKMNSYFVNNPNMIMGKMETITTRFGLSTACKNVEDNLEELLSGAITNIHAEFKDYVLDDVGEIDNNSIEADPMVKNFSYTVKDNIIYYRENSRMYPQTLPSVTESRIIGLIEIRDILRNLIDYQLNDYPEEDIKILQNNLNYCYDKFTKKYDLINSRGNRTAFSDDDSYYLLCSLEILDENQKLKRKADIFSKRTIKPNIVIEKVDMSSEALLLSLGEKGKIDFDYMQSLTGKTKEEIIGDLEGIIFKEPNQDEEIYVTADEYLSGNVREKLKEAKVYNELDSSYSINVEYLTKVIPKDLEANEISVRLGATWIPSEYINEFIIHLLEPSYYVKEKIEVNFFESTGEWNISNKNYDRLNLKAHNSYGTQRANAYKIIEDTLNLRDVRIYDYEVDEKGRKVAVLNKKETAIACSKQDLIKTEFEEWIWSEPFRRDKLKRIYNDKFNSIRNRQYDGNHLKFNGMNPEITLREHQKNAIARILYGGNTLLAHEVGAGKTFTMVASAMESKRLGLCNKSLFVVPNHLVEQFASEFLQLYPSANILVTTKKDFEKSNRKKFCSRIATGEYDAVIISHSQFEKMPMSEERQRKIIQEQIDMILQNIDDLKENHGTNFSIKQSEKTKKNLQNRLEKLNNTERKDDVITFEELGVDRIFIDEAHYYKNLFLYTKMRNVGGIAQVEAQKSSDLFMKCRYIDEITGGKGIVFATGTPVSNSMVELYTMQRYLQYSELRNSDLENFDSWASTFGETITAIELAPEGNGYRAKTRFAKFYNLPELMVMFKEVADIQTADMLKLPVPDANYHNVVVKPSEIQKEMVEELSVRAEKIRNKMVNSTEDNMLKITNDGRKLALDQRLINDMLPNEEEGKVMTCVKNVYKIWEETKENKLAQLVFCDLSTPNKEKFNVYDELKNNLIEKGIPEQEIAFIHSADTDIRKKEMFSKVRNGQIRVLMGSTQKMGAGTNVQEKLIALHDLDCPWRPSDLIQRRGRIIRQGNKNEIVDIFRYVTEGTFDAYLFQLVENKQKFISQIMTDKTPVRFAEDIDEASLSYAEIKALASGNPLILEKIELDTQVAKLKLLKQDYLSSKYSLEDVTIKYYPSEIKRYESLLEDNKIDVEHLKEYTNIGEDKFQGMILNGINVQDKELAGKELLEICKNKTNSNAEEIGEYRGFKMLISFNTYSKIFELDMKNKLSYKVELGKDIYGNITRIDNVLSSIDSQKYYNAKIDELKINSENAKIELSKPFKQEEELKEKLNRLNEINKSLDLNKKENIIMENDVPDDNKVKNNKNYER